jgi:hypothetical protein
MSMPPQGGWPPPQPGPQPPSQPQYGPPPGYQPYPGQQPYPPQAHWQQPPPPPQKGGGTTKWLLVAIAVLLVIGVTIGATLLFTRDGDGSSTPPTSDVPSDIASANDTGPVEIITEEPTCEALTDIVNVLADAQQQGWSDERDSLGPAAEWTESQRSHVRAAVTAIENASDQMVSLARQTPHRVVRELYEQFIAYGRAYAESVPTYTPKANDLAGVNVSISNALQGICTAIDQGSARRSIALDEVGPPTTVAPTGDLGDPQRFLAGSATAACESWAVNDSQFLAGTNAWEALDTSVPASEWSPEQRQIQLDALPVISRFATDMETTGRSSGNAVFEDFAILASLYFRAYVSSGEAYVGADSWLSYTALRLNNAISAACRLTTG